MKWLALVTVAGRVAAADPCADAMTDPTPTPLHDASVDAQRGACLRDVLAADVTSHALIDTPGFHGLIGGDLALAARTIVHAGIELGARLRVVDYAFVQTAVNKVTEARFGPLAIAAAFAGDAGSFRAAVIVAAELPFTRDDMATTRTGGELTGVLTATLSDRWLVHARLGAIAAYAHSDGGTERSFGMRYGADVDWRAGRRIALLAGLEAQVGWYGGLDTILARAGLQFRPAHAWRGSVGLGAPLHGSDQTTVVLGLGIARDLR